MVTYYVSINRNGSLRTVGTGKDRINTCTSIIVSTGRSFTRGFILPTLRDGTVCRRRCPLISTLSQPLVIRGLITITGRCNTATVTRNYAKGNGSRIHFRTNVRTLTPSVGVRSPVHS